MGKLKRLFRFKPKACGVTPHNSSGSNSLAPDAATGGAGYLGNLIQCIDNPYRMAKELIADGRKKRVMINGLVRKGSGLTFLLHVFICTLGIITGLAVIMTESFRLLHRVDTFFSTSYASYLLTDLPAFPLQVLTGIISGLFLGQFLNKKTLQLLWLIPLAFWSLCLILAWKDRTVIPCQFIDSGCSPGQHGFDTFISFLPALTSTAYCLGAWMRISLLGSRKSPK